MGRLIRNTLLVALCWVVIFALAWVAKHAPIVLLLLFGVFASMLFWVLVDAGANEFYSRRFRKRKERSQWPWTS